MDFLTGRARYARDLADDYLKEFEQLLYEAKQAKAEEAEELVFRCTLANDMCDFWCDMAERLRGL